MTLIYTLRNWLDRMFADYPPCIDLRRSLLEAQRKERK